MKPENILIDNDGHVKITDFGFAKVISEKTFTMCGTPEYLAPEIIMSCGHDKGVDWWALGVLIYEMLAGYPPFYDNNPIEIYKKITIGYYEFPPDISLVARKLITSLIEPDVSLRLGCLNVKPLILPKHKYRMERKISETTSGSKEWSGTN
jgi:serine/threonine protein kinase